MTERVAVVGLDTALVHEGAIPKTKRERTHACLDVGGLCKLFARSARRVARFAGCHSRQRRPVHKASARCSSRAAALRDLWMAQSCEPHDVAAPAGIRLPRSYPVERGQDAW